MKKCFSVFISMFCVLCAILGFCLTGCDENGDNETPSSESEVLKLTLYDNDGKTVLYTIDVEKGKAPQKPEDPKKEGFTFSGWFVTPTNKTEYDFTKLMTEDQSAYAQWKTAGYKDDRDWVFVGTKNNWSVDKLEGYHLTKEEGKGNVYKITLDLEIDAEFQLTVLQSDGKLAYDSEGARAAFSHVKEGLDYVKENGGLGTYKNICVTQNGNYTITLVSDPKTDNNEVTIVRNGDMTTPVEEHEIVTYAIKGSKVTGWKDSTDEKYLMTKEEDGTLKLVIELYKNDEFMFVAYEKVDEQLKALSKYIKADVLSEGSCKELVAQASGNIKTTANGTYTFTYNPVEKKLNVTYSTDFSLEEEERPTVWYILGSSNVNGSILKGTDYKLVSEDKQKLTDKGNGVYELILDLYESDEFQICSDGSWSNKHGISMLKEPGENFAGSDNISVKIEGNYTLTLTIDADDETKDSITWQRNSDVVNQGEESVVETYAIKGSKVTNWKDSTEEKYLMITEADGTFKLVIELYANDEFMFVAYEKAEDKLVAMSKYIKGDALSDDSCKEVSAQSNGNIKTTANGTYTFTYNPTENKLNVTYSSDFTLAPEARPTTWYILGNGTINGSVLKLSNWGLNDQKQQKLADKGNGVYEITLDLYKGDEFQICSDGSWSNKHGISTVKEPGDSFGGTSNITVSFEGNYTLTLTIDADDETKDSITWKRNGDVTVPAVEPVVATYAIKGSKVTNWKDTTDEKYLMTKDANGNFTLTIELTENDEFMFVAYEKVEEKLSALKKYIKSDVLTEDSCEEVSALASGNFTVTKAGNYTFVYNATENKIKVTLVK